jgi:hypothetical protein
MILGALLWLVAGLLILVSVAALGALCTPLRITVAFDTAAKPAFKFKMAVYGGLLPVVSTSGKRSRGSAAKTRRPAEPRSRQSSRLDNAGYARRMLRDGPRLICRIASRVKFETVDADISFGLPDPADTGMIYGMLSPVARLVGTAEHSSVSLHPDFNDAALDGHGRITARFTPAALIAPIFSFAWTVFFSPRLSAGNP